MKTIPCPQPPSTTEPFDGKPRVIVIEEELRNLEAAAGFCDKHKPDGGARRCLVCGCEQLSFALDRISYLCGPPNEMECSDYSTHYDETEVVKQVAMALESAKHPRIYTRCPSCHNDTLTINKGHLLCTWHECKDPTMIDRQGEL